MSASSCSSCAAGYNFNGFDCVKTVNQLKKLTLKVGSVTRRDNIAFVPVQPNIIPNGLSMTQRGSFFLVVPNNNDKISFVNQWINPDNTNEIYVAITYETFPTQSAVFLAINAEQLANAYSSIGYTADASSFVSASINVGLPATPASVQIPRSAINNPSSEITNLSGPISNAIKK